MVMGRLQSRLRIGLTDAGMMLLRGVVYVGLAALVIPAFGVLAVLVSVMLVALVVGFVVRPRISLHGHLPDRVIAGQTAQLCYTLRNVGRLAAYHLSLQFLHLPETFAPVGEARVMPRLGPGETTEVVLAIRPQRRGSYRIGSPVCRSSFPFNLFHFGVARHEEETLLVLPAFAPLQLSLPCLTRHVTTGGVGPAGRVGTSPEYVGNRPFMPGDSPRRIDVRAWARLARPATKEYDNDLDSYAALVLDTRVPEIRWRSKIKESRELEAAVCLCASVAYTLHRDCLLDLLLAGADLHSCAGLPKTARLDRIHEVLATVAPTGAYSWEQMGPLLEERLSEISEAIFIVLRLDDVYRQLVEQAGRAGCHCTVVIVGEPDHGAEDRGQKTEDGGRKTEDRGRRTEDGGPRTEDGGWRTDDRGAALSSVLGHPFSEYRLVAPDEILAGRIEHL